MCLVTAIDATCLSIRRRNHRVLWYRSLKGSALSPSASITAAFLRGHNPASSRGLSTRARLRLPRPRIRAHLFELGGLSDSARPAHRRSAKLEARRGPRRPHLVRLWVSPIEGPKEA